LNGMKLHSRNFVDLANRQGRQDRWLQQAQRRSGIRYPPPMQVMCYLEWLSSSICDSAEMSS
jgi:hypothetical protein